MITPEFDVLFPDGEVMFYCNTTSSAVLWTIDGVSASSSNPPPGVSIVNVTTLIVNMSANATLYACSAVVGADIIPSNNATLVLAG